MNDVIIKTDDFPALNLKICDIASFCFFHEANVNKREFGRYVVKVYEDVSHLWGVIWLPIFNLKFEKNLMSFLNYHKNNKGFIPNIKETAVTMFSESLANLVMNPEFRETSKEYIKLAKGFEAKKNLGFVHYLVFDGMFQEMQDAMAPLGIRI